MRWSRMTCAAVMSAAMAAGCSDKDASVADSGSESMAMVTTAPEQAPAPPPMGIGSGRQGRPGSRTEGMAGDVSGKIRGAVAAERDLSGQQSGTVLPGSLPVDAAMPMIIRTGSATIEVDSLEPAIARLRLIASQLGGFVGNTSVQGGREEVRSATVEIKIPAQRWGQLLEGLKPIGKIESQIESAEDVGEEFTDVTARVSNARRLEDRLVALLANRTGKLEEVLSVERELARVREEIERYEGRLRYLRSRAALSTMTVMIHEPAPVLGSRPGSNPIVDAFKAAWRNFVALVAGLISMMGILIPLALLAWLGWKILKSVRGSRVKRDEG